MARRPMCGSDPAMLARRALAAGARPTSGEPDVAEPVDVALLRRAPERENQRWTSTTCSRDIWISTSIPPGKASRPTVAGRGPPPAGDMIRAVEPHEGPDRTK